MYLYDPLYFSSNDSKRGIYCGIHVYAKHESSWNLNLRAESLLIIDTSGRNVCYSRRVERGESNRTRYSD